ncbi:hypothetical protein [Actinomadura sp. 21ATH]|uniref:hypothetical protein n=1 Tax=Actinomadura sp. 21ATH TaxID=1735444 RepID=UPI0035C0D5AC
MRNWTNIIGRAVLVAAGLAIAGAGTAAAEPRPLYGGSEINTPFSAPVNLCGNAGAVAGVSRAWCEGGATVVNEGSGHGSKSLLGGTRYNSPVSLPANACGNGGAVAGVTRTWCEGGAHVDNTGGARAAEGTRPGKGPGDTTNPGLGGGGGTGLPLPGGDPAGVVTDLLGSIGTPLAPGGAAPRSAQQPAGTGTAAGEPAGRPIVKRPPSKLPSTKRVGKAVPPPGPLASDLLAGFGVLGGAGLPDASGLPGAQGLTQELTNGLPLMEKIPGSNAVFTPTSAYRPEPEAKPDTGPATQPGTQPGAKPGAEAPKTSQSSETPEPGEAVRTLLQSMGVPIHREGATGDGSGLGNLDTLTRGLPARITSSSLPK